MYRHSPGRKSGRKSGRKTGRKVGVARVLGIRFNAATREPTSPLQLTTLILLDSLGTPESARFSNGRAEYEIPWYTESVAWSLWIPVRRKKT